MKLDGPELQQFQAALISAFPTRQDLEQMVFHGLDVHLDALTSQGTLSQVVFELLRWAQAQGRLAELVKAALAHNSGNLELQRVAAILSVSSGQSSSDVPPATTLPRIWNIPYPRNPFFTGQEDVLMQLTDVLKAGQATALSQPQAISGLGGIGKTQIAVEFAYRHRQEYEAVLWVLSDTRESLVSGYIAVAQLLNLPLKDEQDQQVIVQAVRSWLQTHNSWLLILDNADELAMVREFLPMIFDGHLLLTTRAQAMGTLAHRIEVDTMTQDVGALFLLRRASLVRPDAKLADAATPDVATAKEICEELGGLPLALDQAGAYREETRCDLLGYQQRYRAQRTLLLKRRGDSVSHHPEPVTTTWSLSFKKIEKKNPMAADLLRLCAFLHPDAIAVRLIIQSARQLVPSFAASAENGVALDEAVKTLRGYSLIHRDESSDKLSMHRLVQAVLQDELEEEKKADRWAEYAMFVVTAAFPRVEYGTWSECECLLPHALQVASSIKKYGISNLQAGYFLHETASYLHARGRYDQGAVELYRGALAIWQEQLGEKHLLEKRMLVANALNNLANLLQEQGDDERATSLYEEALYLNKQQRWDQLLNRAILLNNLAVLYFEQEKDEKTEWLYTLYEEALALSEKLLGSEHFFVAYVLHNLANLHREMKNYTEAEEKYREALRILSKQPGERRYEVAHPHYGLAGLYRTRGDDEQARKEYEYALSNWQEQLGSEHPLVAHPLNGLAEIYQKRGDDGEAEESYQRALTIWRGLLMAEHFQIASPLRGLASHYQKQKRYEEAEACYREAIHILRKKPEHPFTQMIQKDYVSLLQSMGRHDEAKELEEQAHFSAGGNGEVCACSPTLRCVVSTPLRGSSSTLSQGSNSHIDEFKDFHTVMFDTPEKGRF